MMAQVLDTLCFHDLLPGLPVDFDTEAAETRFIDCRHNYMELENHHGKNVLVTRKGAIRARRGDYGVIPGSMGAKSFIVKGKGSEDSLKSCSHGAGRQMSRTEAKLRFTVADLAEATKGIECAKDESVLEEAPGAYKDIDAVMHAQRDLVEVVHTLHQIVCVKGGDD
jgi:tRNA-splicing ligase RtcB